MSRESRRIRGFRPKTSQSRFRPPVPIGGLSTRSLQNLLHLAVSRALAGTLCCAVVTEGLRQTGMQNLGGPPRHAARTSSSTSNTDPLESWSTRTPTVLRPAHTRRPSRELRTWCRSRLPPPVYAAGYGECLAVALRAKVTSRRARSSQSIIPTGTRVVGVEMEDGASMLVRPHNPHSKLAISIALEETRIHVRQGRTAIP